LYFKTLFVIISRDTVCNYNISNHNRVSINIFLHRNNGQEGKHPQRKYNDPLLIVPRIHSVSKDNISSMGEYFFSYICIFYSKISQIIMLTFIMISNIMYNNIM